MCAGNGSISTSIYSNIYYSTNNCGGTPYGGLITMTYKEFTDSLDSIFSRKQPDRPYLIHSKWMWTHHPLKDLRFTAEEVQKVDDRQYLGRRSGIDCYLEPKLKD